jgi:uncharacterized protein
MIILRCFSLLVLAIAYSSARAEGPSFDCSGASRADEQAICGDAELSALELRAANEFKYLRDNVDAEQARRIARRSLSDRRQCADRTACIRQVLSSAVQAYEAAGAANPGSTTQTTGPQPAENQSQTIEETCAKQWDTDPNFSNSKYKDCVEQATRTQGAQLKQKACGRTSCFYRLSRIRGDRVEGIFQGDAEFEGFGYRVEYKSADYGRNIFITDPTGAVTEFGQCGTCNGMDYDQGPLKSASLRYDGNELIIEVPTD